MLLFIMPDGSDDGPPDDAARLALTALRAWQGATAFRCRPDQEADTRQVLEMVAAIQGTRQPAVCRRGLA